MLNYTKNIYCEKYTLEKNSVMKQTVILTILKVTAELRNAKNVINGVHDEFNEICEGCGVKMTTKILSEEEFDEYLGRDEGYCSEGYWWCIKCRIKDEEEAESDSEEEDSDSDHS